MKRAGLTVMFSGMALWAVMTVVSLVMVGTGHGHETWPWWAWTFVGVSLLMMVGGAAAYLKETVR